jgi:hypothetical protein
MTLKQPARFMNDEPFARSEAKRLGKTLVFGQPWRDFDRKIDDALRKIDQPLSLPSYFITSLLTMDARQYSNVILTGDGGDEVFFGYTAFRNWVQAPTAPAATIEPIPCGAPFRFPLSDYGTRQGSVDLVGHGFVKVDKATAENQMEARCPLVDRDLIAFVRAIPMAFWERPGNVPKQPLVDHLIANGVDRSTIFRRKIGTAWPFRYRMLPRLPRIREELEARRGRLRDLGVELAPRPSIAADFQKFDRLWRDYVLATYLTRVLKA